MGLAAFIQRPRLSRTVAWHRPVPVGLVKQMAVLVGVFGLGAWQVQPAAGESRSAMGFMARHRHFTVVFDAVADAPSDLAYIGLSATPVSDPGRLAAAIRFNESGNIDALDGKGFSAQEKFTYAAKTRYHIRMAVDLPAHSYTVFVAPDGQTEKLLASHVAFAPSQADVRTLGFVVTAGGTGGVTVDHVHVPPACPYEAQAIAAGLDDGCANAPEDGFLNPAILTPYGLNRPPWDVAGVDYPVGNQPTQPLIDWQTLGSMPGLDIYLGAVRCDGATAAYPTSSPVLLENIDFTTHGGTYVYVPVQGCAGLTIRHSKFGTAGGQQGCTESPYWMIQDQNPGMPLRVERNMFDDTNCQAGQAAVIYAFGPTVVLYNYFGHLQGQVVQAPPGPYRVEYRFNYLEDCCYSNTHMNFQEFGTSVDAILDVVAFNTTYLYQNLPLIPGEEFQFYGNTGGTQQAAALENNTIIALDTGACQSSEVGCLASYAIHGTYPGTSVVAQPVNTGNFFDPSGMYGAYYPGSLVGWNSVGNVNMVTGQIITPP
jgi:hypothetical protein